uniref:Phospholipid carrier-dependent glycosyltransferase n=1 Tax=Anaerolinea thermolimosa TaxID=229919 RepID=A0A7C4KLG0_9CHLR
MLILPAALTLIFFALFTVAILGIRSRVGYLLAIYLIACANVVFSFELLGLFHLLNNPAAFLGVQTLLLIITAILWWKGKRLPLLGPFTEDLGHLRWGSLGPSLRQHPILWLLALALDLTYAVNAYLVLVVPPNNNDSLYLHMARVVKWLQTGTFLPFDSQISLQVFYPFNVQSLFFWTVLFSSSDQFVGFVQFSAAWVTVLCVYGLARQLNFSKPQAVFAALMWATFPQVFFQSTTTQNDLVPAAFMASGVYFMVVALPNPADHPGRILSLLGVALALGAKQTVFFLLPGLAGMFFLLLWKAKLPFSVLLRDWATTAALCCLLFAAPIYIQNLLSYSHPFGDPAFIQTEAGPQDNTPILKALWINLNRLGYQFIDTSGLPPLIEGYLFRGKAHLASFIYQKLNLPLESPIATNPKTIVPFQFFRRPLLQEDETWFGIFAPFLLLPASISGLIQSIHKKNPLPAGLWMLSLSFTFLEVIVRPGWDTYLGRNFILALLFLTPFLGRVYPRQSGFNIPVLVVVALSGYMVFNFALNNTSKPLIGQKAIWILDRADKITLQNFNLREPARLVEQSIPENASLALPGGLWEYPFFDPHFHRHLLPIGDSPSSLDADWLRDHNVHYALLPRERSEPAIPSDGRVISTSQHWMLVFLP